MRTHQPDRAVDELLFALADPTRRTVFQEIRAKPGTTTSDLCAQVTSMTRWGVMKHIAVLRDAGLIQTMTTGRQRRHYAERGALEPLRDWIGAISE
jgi:DNA-binding transcriptional ArsR family regulator